MLCRAERASQFNHLPPFIRLSSHHEFSRPGVLRLLVSFLEERILARGIGWAVIATSLGARCRTCTVFIYSVGSGAVRKMPSEGDGRSGESSKISLTMALRF